MKTSGEIATGIYKYVKEHLGGLISGQVINDKDRIETGKEDIVIKVLANNLAQLQESYVNVNIYVPDVLRKEVYVRKDERVIQLERAAMDLFEKPFRVDGARVVIENQTTLASNNGRDHVINNKLLYQIINE